MKNKDLSKSLSCAAAFIGALPDDIPAPEVGQDNDGEITLEWYRSPYLVVSISFSPEGKIAYAALLGNNKEHGTATTGEKSAEQIIGLIRQLPKPK